MDHPVPADDLEETVGAAMAGVLSDRLEGARQILRRRAIEGDGDCAFRAVAVQAVRYGDDGPSRLRHAAVAYVEARRKVFTCFFGEGNNEETLNEWLRAMRQDRITWGDNIALSAMARLLDRPLAISRLWSANRPEVIVPPTYNDLIPTDPIYLEFDDLRPGAEHYTALLLGSAERLPKKRRGDDAVFIFGSPLTDAESEEADEGR